MGIGGQASEGHRERPAGALLDKRYLKPRKTCGKIASYRQQEGTTTRKMRGGKGLSP